jgi:thiol-disulfide isomerase/thioredoxin
LTLWISQRDHLLRRVSDEWVRSDGISRSVETYTNVKVNLNLPPSTFEFTPPDNGLAVDSVESLLPPRPVIGPKLNIGDAVPAAAFGATDVDGKRVEAADYEGKVVLLDFWATWCGPCIRQIPSLVATYQQYHDQGLEIVGYAIEEAKNKDKLPAFTLKHGMAWRQVWDKDAVIANACGPTNGVPFAIVVGRDGRIAALGNPGEGLDVDAAIRAALAKPLPSASTL